jgi:TP901 family phage tail tape measure protein
VGGGFSSLGDIGVKALNGIAVAAAAAGAAVAVGVGAGLASAVNAAAGFESQMSAVGAALQLDSASAEFQGLTDLALELGATTAYSASEAGQAIENLARNGATAQEIMGGLAQATVDLAAATGGDLAGSADIMTDAMTIFGDSITSAGDAINGITGVTVVSKMGIDDYRLALAQAGGVAGAVGVEFDDFNTAIAGIAPLFASGSDAGTSFKTMLQRLAPTTGPATAAMAQLGLLTADGSSKFFDAQGNLRDMAEVAGLLQGALAPLSEEQRNVALSTIFGTDAMRAAVGLAELGADGFNELAGSIAEVDAAQQAAARLDNFNGALEQMRGSFETLQIVIGSLFLPILTDLLNNYVTPAINYFTKLAQSITETGTPLNTLAMLLTGQMPSFSAMVDLTGQLANVIGVDLAGPLVGVIDGFGNLFAAIADAGPLGSEAQEAFGFLGEKIGGFIDVALPMVMEGLGRLGEQLMTWGAENAPGFLASLSELGAALGAWVVEAIPQLVASLANARTALVEWVLASLPEWAAQLDQLNLALWNWVAAALPQLGTELGKVAALLIEKTGEFIAVAGPKLLELAGMFVTWVATEALPRLPGELVTIGTAIVTGIGNFLAEVGPPLAELGLQFLDWVAVDVLPTLPGKLAEIGTAIITGIGDFIGNVGAEAAKIGTAIIDGISGAIGDGVNAVIEAAKGAAQAALDAALDFLGIASPSRVFAEEVGEPVALGMAEGILAQVGAMRGAVEALGDEALDAVAGLADRVRDLLDETLGGIAGLANARIGGLDQIIDLEDAAAKAAEAVEKAAEAEANARTRRADQQRKAAEEMADLEREKLDAQVTAAQDLDPEKRRAAAERLLELDREMADLRRRSAEDDRAAQEEIARLEKERLDAVARASSAKEVGAWAADQLREAQRQAAEIAKTDPLAAEKFLTLRQRQIAQLAELQDRYNTTTAQGTKELVAEQIALLRQAQAAELQQLDLQLKARAAQLADLAGAGETTGSALVDGVIAGVEASSAALAAALQAALESALAAARAAMGIASPSRVAAATIGEPIGEGIEVGLARSLVGVSDVLRGSLLGLGSTVAPPATSRPAYSSVSYGGDTNSISISGAGMSEAQLERVITRVLDSRAGRARTIARMT